MKKFKTRLMLMNSAEFLVGTTIDQQPSFVHDIVFTEHRVYPLHMKQFSRYKVLVLTSLL